MMQCAELARDTGGRRIVKVCHYRLSLVTSCNTICTNNFIFVFQLIKIPGKQLQSQKTFLAF